ncbi:MAG: DMT family transporter [Methanobacteriota archaeon]
MATRFSAPDLGLLSGLGVLWGSAFLFITVGLEHFSPILLAALRFDLVALAMFVVALVRRAPLVPHAKQEWIAILIAAVLNVTAYHALLFWGQQYTTAGIAAIIVGLNPTVTTVFSRVLLRDDRVGWGGVLGLALGLSGIVVLAAGKPGPLFDARGVGELAVVGAILSWSLGSVLVKRSGHRMHVATFIAWHSAAGAVLLHAAAFAFEGGGHGDTSREGLTALLYLALASSGLGFVVYFTLLSRVGPIRTNLVSHVAAVVAAVAGAIFLGDPIEVRAFAAFALIAGGFALVARR